MHKNYEALNLIGYGLAKFDNFAEVFGFSSKSSFYNYCVKIDLAETESVVKNRQDLFDHFFDNGRKGWWQKGDAYIHRKIKIDTLFGSQDVFGYVNIVKTYLQTALAIEGLNVVENPIINSRFRKMQETGIEAEIFFINNFESISDFRGGVLEDARQYGDGYDFQITANNKYYLAEVKGIRGSGGGFRMTEKEYTQALKYKDKYALLLILDLDTKPLLKLFFDPISVLNFQKVVKMGKIQNEYRSSV